ncbi:MAG: serine hydrolase domain-containing protein, partial [Pseudomonadota bacterium]
YGDSEQITVRMLLNHTSGLPRHYKFYYTDDQAPLGHGDFIERYGRALLPPGQAFDYSNAGYGVLERIIEHVSGLDYEEYLRARIYEKAGMDRAFIPPVETPRGPEATRYRHYDEPVPFYDFDHRGASSMYASVTDLLNFANSLMVTGDRPGLLSAASATQMWPATTEEDSYGLGFAVWNKDGETIVHHAGGMPGVSARLMFVPRTRTAVVFLMNTGGDSWDPTVRILREFQPELFLNETPIVARSLRGSWRGQIDLDGGTAISLEMRFTDRGWFSGGKIATQYLSQAPLVQYGSGAISLMLRKAGLSQAGEADYQHGVRFTLMPTGDQLLGYVTAQERPTRGRVGNAISYPIVLERVSIADEADIRSP